MWGYTEVAVKKVMIQTDPDDEPGAIVLGGKAIAQVRTICI